MVESPPRSTFGALLADDVQTDVSFIVFAYIVWGKHEFRGEHQISPDERSVPPDDAERGPEINHP